MIIWIFLTCCLTQIAWSNKIFSKYEYRTPGFDFGQLDILEKFEQFSDDCGGKVKEHVTRFRYPVMEDGVEKNSSIDITNLVAETLIEEIAFADGRYLGKVTRQPHLNCFPQDHPEVIKAIKEVFLDPPSTEPYALTNSNNDYPAGDGQSIMLDHRYFNEEVKGGFFIEAGAVDGERQSTTLYFELKHGWNGLLVEPVPNEYTELRKRNRKAWSVQTCLSPVSKPAYVAFSTASSQRTGPGIVQAEDTGYGRVSEMQCLPLFSLILALGNPRVDYISLDVEGSEFEVLSSLPWDKVDIRALSVEVEFATEFNSSSDKIRNLLEQHGYLLLDTIVRDDVYVRMPGPHLEQVKSPHLPLPLFDPLMSQVTCPAVSTISVLTRTHYPFPHRLCVYFNTPYNKLTSHCKRQFPRDFYRSYELYDLPRCLKRKICPWSYRAILNTYKYSAPWRAKLFDTCYHNAGHNM